MRNTTCTEAFRAPMHMSLCNNRVQIPRPFLVRSVTRIGSLGGVEPAGQGRRGAVSRRKGAGIRTAKGHWPTMRLTGMVSIWILTGPEGLPSRRSGTNVLGARDGSRRSPPGARDGPHRSPRRSGRFASIPPGARGRSASITPRRSGTIPRRSPPPADRCAKSRRPVSIRRPRAGFHPSRRPPSRPRTDRRSCR